MDYSSYVEEYSFKSKFDNQGINQTFAYCCGIRDTEALDNFKRLILENGEKIIHD